MIENSRDRVIRFFYEVWRGGFGLRNKGEDISYSKKKIRCKKRGCKTWINGYRLAKGNCYCTVHAVSETMKTFEHEYKKKKEIAREYNTKLQRKIRKKRKENK